MSDFEYYNDLDSHPFSGLLKLSIPFNVKVKNDEYIERFFNGTPNYGQVKDVTIGKVYTIYAVEGYGDVADFIFMNDVGIETRLGRFAFRCVNKEGKEIRGSGGSGLVFL